jgi:DsbC/DsbD-like thiol-disulfide interchange protein
MKRILAILIAVSILPNISNAATPVHAHARILADTTAIAAGKPFTIGVRFSMDRGWHVYWKYPGDAGLATKVNITAPAGFTVGPILYPTPERFDQPGNITAFGYENNVLLMAEITPPANLPADFKANFKAEVSWLCCADVCIPGKDSLSLELPVSDKPQADNAELFDNWKKQIPVDTEKSGDVKIIPNIMQVTFANVNEINHLQVIQLGITWSGKPPTDIQFLPTNLDEYNLGNSTVKTNGNETRISSALTPLAGKSPAEAKFEVVIGYKNEQGERRGISTILTIPKWQKP